MKISTFKVRKDKSFKTNTVFIGRLHAKGAFIIGVALFGYAVEIAI